MRRRLIFMDLSIRNSIESVMTAWRRLSWSRQDVVRLTIFSGVEIAAELLKWRLLLTAPKPFSAPIIAALICACWTFVAHRRYAFRGLATRLAPSGQALAPFVMISLAAGVLRLLIDPAEPRWSLLSILGWAIYASVKYALVLCFIWSPQPRRVLPKPA